MTKGSCEVFDGRTGETVNLIRAKCSCGHVMTFLSNRSKICRYCGKVVFPSEKSKFIETIGRNLKRI